MKDFVISNPFFFVDQQQKSGKSTKAISMWSAASWLNGAAVKVGRSESLVPSITTSPPPAASSNAPNPLLRGQCRNETIFSESTTKRSSRPFWKNAQTKKQERIKRRRRRLNVRQKRWQFEMDRCRSYPPFIFLAVPCNAASGAGAVECYFLSWKMQTEHSETRPEERRRLLLFWRAHQNHQQQITRQQKKKKKKRISTIP